MILSLMFVINGNFSFETELFVTLEKQQQRQPTYGVDPEV